MGKYFESKGFSWLNLTLPGHDSTPEDLRDARWKDWIEYVDEQVEATLRQYDDVYFAGLSLGGAMTLYALSKHKDLRGGIALAPPWEILNWYQRFLIHIPFLNFWINRSDNEIADIRNDKNRPIHRAYMKHHTESVRQLYYFVKYVRSRLGLIQNPVLIVHSTKDQVLPFADARKIFASIPAEHKEFLQVEQSGHVLTRDNDAEYIFSRALEFTEKHKSR